MTDPQPTTLTQVAVVAFIAQLPTLLTVIAKWIKDRARQDIIKTAVVEQNAVTAENVQKSTAAVEQVHKLVNGGLSQRFDAMEDKQAVVLQAVADLSERISKTKLPPP